MSKESAVYATSNGAAYPQHPYGAKTAGPGGPLLLEDFNLIDDLAHFARERIPERVVHAKGGGAHGYFELTDSLSDITYARPFQQVGYKAPVTARFSTVGGESGSPDTARDPRGFSVKIKTDVGNLDWVFNNTPVFFIRDPAKFPRFIHTQKRDPATHLDQNTDSTRAWDYWVQNPESLHQVTYMMGRRGVPKSWATMNGYSGHTFKNYNEKGELTYVQYHIKSDEGFETLSNEEAGALAGSSKDHNIKDLYDRIAAKKFPSYTVYVQTMTPKQAEEFRYSINDLTKVWSHKDYPLRKFGKIVLNQNPDNYFAEIEQVAFSPAHLVPGVEASNDPVLQSRLFSYSDTHRYRLGVNYQQLPVNKPFTFEQGSGCPFLAGNFQRDGAAAIDNQGSRRDYISQIEPINAISSDPTKLSNGLTPVVEAKYKGVVPQSGLDKFTILQEEQTKRAHEEKIWLKSFDYVSGIGELDLEQPRKLYVDVYTPKQKDELIEVIVGHASKVSNDIVKEKVPLYWGLLDEELGAKVAKGLGVKYARLSLEEYVAALGLAPSY